MPDTSPEGRSDPVSEREVRRACEELYAEIANIEEEVSILCNRLRPVARDKIPLAGVEKEDDPYETELAREVYQGTRRLRDIITETRGLRDRLEI